MPSYRRIKPKRKNHCSTVGHIFHHVGVALPSLSFAAKEALNVGAGLGSENVSPYMLVIGPSIAGLSAFYYTFPAVKTNLHDFNKVFLKGEIPEDWPELSASQEKASKWTATPITVINGLFDGANTFLFTDTMSDQWSLNLPKNTNTLISLALAGLSIVNSGATEGFETYKIIRNNGIGKQREPYDSKLSATFAWTIGTPLFLLKSLQDWIQGYYSVKTIFGIDTTALKISIASLSGVNMLPGFCFGGMYTINAIDQFIGALRRRDYSYTACISFGIALFLAGWLSLLKRPFNEKMYHDVTGDANFDNHDYMNVLAEGLSYANASQETIQGTRALYPLVYCLVRQAQKSSANACVKVSDILPKIIKYLAKATPSEKEPLLSEPAQNYDGSTSQVTKQESCLTRFFSLFSRKSSEPSVPEPKVGAEIICSV